jgi:hypothetical protein
MKSDRRTIASLAVIASALATLLHEGLGHGVTAWLRGDQVTELTSNHLSSMVPDRWVSAGGTLVNLAVGAACLALAPRLGRRANARYALWLLGALNLFPGAGYFMFSGILGLGDWAAVIEGLPHPWLWRVAMTLFGVALYIVVTWRIARGLAPFLGSRKDYNRAARFPYLVACIFSSVAGAFDPLGLQLWLISTIPAAFGGSSGFLWADSLLPKELPSDPLLVTPSRPLWIAAAVIGLAYILVLGRGVHFGH